MRKLKLDELKRLSSEEFKESPKVPITIVLDNVRSAANVGSVFRTADCIGVSKVILTGITARPPHREIHKTAIGATESVLWEYAPDTCNALEQCVAAGQEVILVEQTTESVPLQTFVPDPTKHYVLVFGNEVNGVSEEVVEKYNQAIEIEQFGTKHSFNIAVCAGIVLWTFGNALR